MTTKTAAVWPSEKSAQPSPVSAAATSPPSTPDTVLNVVCQDLKNAEEVLRAAGIRTVRSDDASGRGRRQIIDSNWIVVRQSPTAGSSISQATVVVLGTVKFGEPTGDSGCRS
ncbi:PASTA domain-containing protein [Solihabitans fulvus]|uniref:PASTA domain-containing protein n=1 Tax=Solihabitans fulvus TaxID=1892852 RepID=UPI001661A85E|nr:PASTA domain-containing protein [Solihabitans fulvus]